MKQWLAYSYYHPPDFIKAIITFNSYDGKTLTLNYLFTRKVFLVGKIIPSAKFLKQLITFHLLQQKEELAIILVFMCDREVQYKIPNYKLNPNQYL